MISGVEPIYFNDTPAFRQIAMGSVIGSIIPGFDIPNAVLVLFLAAIIANVILAKTVLGRYDVALGSNEEATRLSGVNVDCVEDRHLHAGRRLQRLGRRDHGGATKLGAARLGCGV